MKEIYELIHLLPGEDGWHKLDSEDAFRKSAATMMEVGMHPQDINQVLRDLYVAMSSEFGS